MPEPNPILQPPPPTLQFPSSSQASLLPYLPAHHAVLPPNTNTLPHLTLTYAASLDSHIALGPGRQTALSGATTKAMTHFLRAHHDAILVGAGTALADDPGLNCRLAGGPSQPLPVVLDPAARWRLGAQSRVIRTAREGRGRGPVLVWDEEVLRGEGGAGRRREVEALGARVVGLKRDPRGRFAWVDILKALAELGCRSVMVEGGARVINELLGAENVGLVSSVIVTIAPMYLGLGGVNVSPLQGVDEKGEPRVAVRLRDVRWLPMDEDVVMCGRPGG